jgi:hypothetical protein
MSLAGWTVLAVIAAVAIFGGLAQVLAYRREGSILSGAQLVLRLAMGGLLLAVLALSLWGLPHLAQLRQELPMAERIGAARQLAAFWTLVVLLLALVVALAIVDLRYLRATRHRARAAMYRNLARLQEELRARNQPPAKPDGPPPEE